jgi:hypothetical protein
MGTPQLPVIAAPGDGGRNDYVALPDRPRSRCSAPHFALWVQAANISAYCLQSRAGNEGGRVESFCEQNVDRYEEGSTLITKPLLGSVCFLLSILMQSGGRPPLGLRRVGATGSEPALYSETSGYWGKPARVHVSCDTKGMKGSGDVQCSFYRTCFHSRGCWDSQERRGR